MTEEPTGGDLADCLSSTEVDRILGAELVLPSRVFHQLRNGEATFADIRARIEAAVKQHTTARFVVHVRHHWVLQCFRSLPAIEIDPMQYIVYQFECL